MSKILGSLPCSFPWQIFLSLSHVKSLSHFYMSNLPVMLSYQISLSLLKQISNFLSMLSFSLFFQVKSSCLSSMSNLCLFPTSDFPISILCQIFRFFYMSNLFVSFPCHISPSLFHVKAFCHFSWSNLPVSFACIISKFLFQLNILSIFSSQIYPFLVHVKSRSLLCISNLCLYSL